jgi:hypothetical protein
MITTSLDPTALKDNVRFYRVVKGRHELQGANLKVTSNQWHTLGLRAEGATPRPNEGLE